MKEYNAKDLQPCMMVQSLVVIKVPGNKLRNQEPVHKNKVHVLPTFQICEYDIEKKYVIQLKRHRTVCSYSICNQITPAGFLPSVVWLFQVKKGDEIHLVVDCVIGNSGVAEAPGDREVSRGD